MESEKSTDSSERKRTESSGGNSDSDLSEGWNIIDHLDNNNQDLPSSDGESVEVIDADDECQEQAEEVLKVFKEENFQIVSQQQCLLVSHDEEIPDIPHADQNNAQEQEKIFDASLYWFLLVTITTVLVSNLAFMAAEHAFGWNNKISIDSPSFLQDLPTKSKPLKQGYIGWADNEDVSVVSVDYTMLNEEVTKETTMAVDEFHSSYPDSLNIKDHSNTEKEQNSPTNLENVEILEKLRYVSRAPETQSKFTQALLILDALKITLNDLKEVVTENPKLNQVLHHQRNNLYKTLSEIELGVTRSVDKIASNVVNKLQMLENRFEKQWCMLEKNGLGRLNGVFFDCENSREEVETLRKSRSKQTNNYNKRVNYEEKQFSKDSFHYEVDNDSTGKVYSKSGNEKKGEFEYLKLVSNDKTINEKTQKSYKKEKSNKNVKQNQQESNIRIPLKYEGKRKKHNKKDKYGNGKEYTSDKNYGNKESHSFRKKRHSIKTHQGKQEIPTTKKTEQKNYEKKLIRQYLKDQCKKTLKFGESAPINYDNINFLLKYLNLQVSKDEFDSIYNEYCKSSHSNIKFNEERESKYVLSEESGKNYAKNFQNKHSKIIEDPNKRKVIEINIVDTINSHSDEGFDQNKVSMTANQPREWVVLLNEKPPSSNNTNLKEDWFIRAGESRTKARWSDHRSDWLFERASYRRNHPQPPHWFWGRRKNWFFRRAWARQQCRLNPDDNLSHLPHEETITIPNSGSNLR